MDAGEFGPYRLVERLGRGGMGEVWRAVDTRKDREVAIKVLGAWLAGDVDFARRFRREAALAARLYGPHVVPIHDYGEVDGHLFIDMALVPGTDLARLLAQSGPLPAGRAVGLVEQVAVALAIAHEAGTVHRDVKPSNVIVTHRGGRDHAYLIDFGIARAVDGTQISRSGAVVGTPSYMAPERFDGDGDHRADVYSLAAVLFECLTGRPPFTASSLWAHLKAHHEELPPRPSEHRPDVPAQLDAVVARGMAKAPADRFATASDLAAAARSALDGSRAPLGSSPQDHGPASSADRPTLPPTPAPSAGAVPPTHLAADPHASASPSPPSMPEDPRPHPLPTSAETRSDAAPTTDERAPETWLRSAIAPPPSATSPQSSASSWPVDRPGAAGERRAWLAPAGRVLVVAAVIGVIAILAAFLNRSGFTYADAAVVNTLNLQEGGPRYVAVTPDGTRAYVTNYGSGSVSVIDVTGERVVGTLTVEDSPVGVAVTPDGASALISNSGSDSMSFIDVKRQQVVGTIMVEDSPSGVAVTPDGVHALVVNSGSASVSVVDVASRQVIRTITVGDQPFGVAVTPDGVHALITNLGPRSVSIIDLARGQVISTIVVQDPPGGVAVSPDGTRALVTDSRWGSISIIDLASEQVVSTVAGQGSPTGVAVTPDGTRAFVANSTAGSAYVTSGSVSVIDLELGQIVGTVPVQHQAEGIVVTPDGSRALVTQNNSSGSDSVSVLDTGLRAG